jgi:uncharacterized protein (TIGR03083 family)
MLTRIRSAYTDFEAALNAIPTERWTDPAFDGGWSVKDILAHITWSEREMRNVLRDRSMAGGSDLWQLPTNDERNAITYEQDKDRPLDDVLTEHRAVHAELVSLIERLTDDELNSAAPFAEMPPDWSMAMLLPGNTHKHYAEHAEMLKAWHTP